MSPWHIPTCLRNKQVEQNRASVVFLHQPKLARSPADESGRNRESHCRDRDKIGTQGTLRTRYRKISKGQKISDEQMADLSIKLDKFHGEWIT